jgi:hypothetical protein
VAGRPAEGHLIEGLLGVERGVGSDVGVSGGRGDGLLGRAKDVGVEVGLERAAGTVLVKEVHRRRHLRNKTHRHNPEHHPLLKQPFRASRKERKKRMVRKTA